MPIHPPTGAGADVSVVLVATNCRGDIERNVAQLREQEDVDLEVVVIDNNSSDGTREYLEQQADLLLIANSENRWLNPARAQGVARTTAPLILFFAPDTSMPPDTVRLLKDSLERDPKVGLVGPRLFGQHGHDMVNGQFPLPSVRWVVTDALGLHRRVRKHVLPPEHAPDELEKLEEEGDRRVEWLNGSCMLMRRSVLDAIGGLDERFLFDWEELDLARRVDKAGYEMRLVFNTNVMHRAKGTPVKTGVRERIFVGAEQLYFKKHHSLPAWLAVRLARDVQRVMRGGGALLRGARTST